MPRFVFWDCDNTLIENAGLHWRKHHVTLQSYGYSLPETIEIRKTFYHNNGNQNWQWLVDNLGLEIPCDDYLKEIDTWYHAHIHEIPLRAGVPWALQIFKENNIKQCVVTNARRASVQPMLEVQGIVPYFEFIWTKECYSERKPHPMPYQSAIKNMEIVLGIDVSPEDCLAIEDDPLGVTSARHAGLQVIQRRLTRDEPPSSDADLSLYDEDEFITCIGNLFGFDTSASRK
jgi:beta-phosphoglucomutase-like phosphatase (HAD superfamily)